MRRYINLLTSVNFSTSTIRALKVSLFINRVRLAVTRLPFLKKLVRRLDQVWFLDSDGFDQMDAPN